MPKGKSGKVWKIITIVLGSLIVIFILLAWDGYNLEKQDQSANQLNQPTMQFPTAQYKDFTFAQDASSFDPNNAENTKNRDNGVGMTTQVLNTGDSFVEINALSAQTRLKMPFGWYGLDNGQKTVFYSPDNKLSLSLRFVDSGDLDFSQLKDQVKQEYQGYEATGAKIQNSTLADGSFLSQAKGIVSNGERLSILSVYTPNPDPNSHYNMKLLFSAPENDFDRFLGLIGLILKDREIIWTN